MIKSTDSWYTHGLAVHRALAKSLGGQLQRPTMTKDKNRDYKIDVDEPSPQGLHCSQGLPVAAPQVHGLADGREPQGSLCSIQRLIAAPWP